MSGEILAQLRACGEKKTALTTHDGVVSGFIDQERLVDGAVFVLLGDTPQASPAEATLVAIDSIVSVSSGTAPDD